jgi:tetratricopeptide (TPR) repeat protein
MPKSKIKTPKSLFMLSSYGEKVGETAKRLSYLARQAYSIRDFKKLSAFSEMLINLSPVSEDEGHLFQALAMSRQGSGDTLQAKQIFEQLANSSKTPIRAASLLALGVSEYNRKNYRESARLLIEASKVSLSENICAPITFVNSQNALSIIQADNGAYHESLKLLQGVEPIVRNIGCYFPAMVVELYNNYACGFLDSGDTQTALHFINKALQNPFASRYPELLETNEAINSSLNNFSRSQIFVPHPEKLNNLARPDFTSRNKRDHKIAHIGKVLPYPAWSANWLEIYLCINNSMHLYEIISIPRNRQEAEQMFFSLLAGLDDISSEKWSEEITIETYYCSRNVSILISDEMLNTDRLDDLRNLLKDISE